MKLEEDVNEFGTPVSVHRCPSCGRRFTVCPPAGDDWGGCLADECGSYDVERDIEIGWDVAIEAGLIQRDGV